MHFTKNKITLINKIWLVGTNEIAAAYFPSRLSVSSHMNSKVTYSDCISNLRQGHENWLTLKSLEQMGPFMPGTC